MGSFERFIVLHSASLSLPFRSSLLRTCHSALILLLLSPTSSPLLRLHLFTTSARLPIPCALAVTSQGGAAQRTERQKIKVMKDRFRLSLLLPRAQLFLKTLSPKRQRHCPLKSDSPNPPFPQTRSWKNVSGKSFESIAKSSSPKLSCCPPFECAFAFERKAFGSTSADGGTRSVAFDGGSERSEEEGSA